MACLAVRIPTGVWAMVVLVLCSLKTIAFNSPLIERKIITHRATTSEKIGAGYIARVNVEELRLGGTIYL